MRLVFTKLPGKYDRLDLERADGSRGTINCPKQGMIPHDMVHWAVETVLDEADGFLGRVAAGAAAAFTLKSGEAGEAIERIVETVQAECWSGPVPTDQFLDIYAHACGARGHAVLPIEAAQVEAIRARIAELTAQWDAVPLHGALVLGETG